MEAERGRRGERVGEKRTCEIRGDQKTILTEATGYEIV